MSNKKGLNRSTYLTLGLGVLIGGLAFASLQEASTRAHAGPDGNIRAISGVTTENMAVLRNLDATFASLAEFVEPSVVHIRSESKRGVDMLGRRMGATGGEGTGVIFRADGWILTNDHVVGGFDKVTVILSDGREFVGTVRRAKDNDLAVVKIDAKDLPVAQFGDSSKVKPGQYAMAVGSPFGLDNSVTIGHISALGRTSMVPDSRLSGLPRYYSDLIQTDTAINMGNSGGPLVNVDGQVIGINSAIYSGTGGNVGIGFAIPSNQARMIGDLLIEKGKIVSGYMGLTPDNLKPYQLKEMNVEGGALISSVEGGGPADKAGIKKDDLVVRIGTHQVRSQLDLRNAMLEYQPGSKVSVEVIRNKDRKTFNVAIGERPTTVTPEPEPETRNWSGKDLPDGITPFENLPENPDIFRYPPKQKEREGDVGPIREGKAKLGVTVETLTPKLREQFRVPAGIEGALVMSVAPDSVAEKLDIEAGSVITKIGDQSIKSAEDLIKAMSNVNWGDKKAVSFSKYSANASKTVTQDVEFK